jgi:hypothetical protein
VIASAFILYRRLDPKTVQTDNPREQSNALSALRAHMACSVKRCSRDETAEPA